MARGQRTRLAPGIYQDRYGIAAVVKVGGQRDEGRFRHGTPLPDIEAWRLERRAEFLRQRGTVGPRGSLAADIRRFLDALPPGRRRIDYEDLLTHWRNSPLGLKDRAQITEFDVRAQLAAWTDIAASTRRHRLRALRVVYRHLDGVGARTPTAGITVRQEKRAPRAIPIALVERLLANLPDQGRAARGDTRSAVSLTKIRLRVMAWTGLPQAQLERLRQVDVDFLRQRMRPQARRKGHGAAGRWVPLIPPAVEALRDYAAAHLWERSFSRESMNATWQRTIARTRREIEAAAMDTGDLTELEAFDGAIPDGCRPYDLRHSFLTEAYRLTGDLAATAELGQHADLATTRQYTDGAVSERAAAAVAAMSARWTK